MKAWHKINVKLKREWNPWEKGWNPTYKTGCTCEINFAFSGPTFPPSRMSRAFSANVKEKCEDVCTQKGVWGKLGEGGESKIFFSHVKPGFVGFYPFFHDQIDKKSFLFSKGFESSCSKHRLQSSTRRVIFFKAWTAIFLFLNGLMLIPLTNSQTRSKSAIAGRGLIWTNSNGRK